MGVPTRSPTHRDLDLTKLASLGMEVEELADGEPVDTGALVDLAAERGKPVSHYLAGLALASEVEQVTQHPVNLVVCAGKCQSWGALDVLDRATDLWERRRDQGLPLFDVTVRSCLDRCEHAAVCELRGPDGTAVMTETTARQVEDALTAILG